MCTECRGFIWIVVRCHLWKVGRTQVCRSSWWEVVRREAASAHNSETTWRAGPRQSSPGRPFSPAHCSCKLWTHWLLKDSEKSRKDGILRREWKPYLYGGTTGVNFSLFSFLSGLEPKAGSWQSCSSGAEVAKLEKSHLFGQKTRKIQAGKCLFFESRGGGHRVSENLHGEPG